jgi:outer membrane PBP1 activator LpoA protein
LSELKSIEYGVKSNEEAYKKMLEKEQMAKEKENHQFRLNQIDRQIQSSKERRTQHIERTITLRGLGREQELESQAKIELILAKEDYKELKNYMKTEIN